MGFSIWQLLIVLLIVLLFFGPQRLEGIGSSLGKAIRGFKKGIDDGTDAENKKQLAESSQDIEVNKVETKEEEKV